MNKQRLLLTIAILGVFTMIHAKMADSIEINNAAIRLMPPSMDMTAAFMTISNKSSDNVKIIGVTSDLSDNTEIHTHIIKKDGTAVMSQMQNIVINSNKKRELKKGGDHIMFIGLKDKLKENNTYNLNIHFSDGSQKKQKIKVKKF